MIENVSRPITDLQEVNNRYLAGICCRMKKTARCFFLDQSLPGAPRHVRIKFRAKKSKNGLRRTNVKSNLMPEVEYTQKTGNYDPKPWFLHLTARNSKCPRRCWELDAEFLHTCLMCPCRAFQECAFLSFPPKMWGSLRPKYPPPPKNKLNIWRKKRKSVRPRLGRDTWAH